MKKRPQEPTVPVERHETIRKAIASLIEGRSFSAREISGEVRISEKEVYDHLEHIQRTMNTASHHLVHTPAACRKCGFVFRKRERLRRPGRCPVCHGESMEEPLFSIMKR